MVRYFWSESNGTNRPTVRYMDFEPSTEYYNGMPLKKNEAGAVMPTTGEPEYICMWDYQPDGDIRTLEIPVIEIFPDTIYEKWNEDGTVEEVRFGSGGGGLPSDLVETVPDEVPLEITFDGDLTGKEVVVMNETSSVVKVSDEVLSIDQVLGSVITCTRFSGVIQFEATLDNTQDMSSAGIPAITVFSEDMTTLVQVIKEDVSAEGFTFSAGIWFMNQTGDTMNVVNSLTNPNVLIPGGERTQIKPEFMPPHKHKWDDIKDQPFGDKSVSAPLNITFDGDVTGKETAQMQDLYLVKVSDAVLSKDQVVGCNFGFPNEDGSIGDYVLTSDMVMDGASEGIPIIMINAIESTPQAVIVNGDTTSIGLILSCGVWFVMLSELAYARYLSNPNVTITTTEIKKLDNKFIDAEWMAVGGREQFEGEILPETTFRVDKLYGGNRWTRDEVLSKCGQLKEGDTVRIVLNGAVFDYTVKYAYVPTGTGGFEYLYAGNLGAALSSDGLTSVADTGEPFCIKFGGSDFTTGEFEAECLMMVTSEEYVGVDNIISISAVSSIVPLPEKYIPDFKELTLISPSGKKFSVTVDDSGKLTAVEV